MPSQKIKRISLGIIAFLILVIVSWSVNQIICWMHTYGYPWKNQPSTFETIVILLPFLGLYFIAKILIEIFK
jgi:hypothetical protein